MTQFFFWFALAFLFLLGEVGHPGLCFFLSFTVGACASGIASLWTPSLIIQSSIFLGMTTLIIILLRIIVARHEHIQLDVHYHSNIDALMGKKAIVVSAIKPDMSGQVKINGELWAARADQQVARDTIVQVMAVSGSHVRVRPVEKQ